MANDSLISCLECGARISPKASSCPKCKTEHFRGVRCNLCKQVLKASEATTWDKVDQRPVTPTNFDSQLYHRMCLQTIIPETLPSSFPCKECAALIKRSIVIQWSGYGYDNIPCPECGTPAPVEMDRCQQCNIPVFLAGHHCVLTKPRSMCFKGYRSSGTACYHAACYSLYFDKYISESKANVFGYEAEYSKGQLIRESQGDTRAQHVLRLRYLKAKEQGKSDLFFMQLNGPFVSFWGSTIERYGIAKKSLGVRNLSGREREMADKVQSWGYNVFVSRHPFELMIRI